MRKSSLKTGPAKGRRLPVNKKRVSKKKRGISPAVRKVFSGFYRIILAACVCTLVAWGGIELREHVLTAEYFMIDEIVVTGNRALNADQICRIAGIARGENIFRLDAEEIAGKLAGSDWISEARVTRNLPRRVDIEIVEHSAWAMMHMDGFYLVDGDGEVFKTVEEDDDLLFPVITGIGRGAYINNRQDAKRRIREARGVYRAYVKQGLNKKHPLSEIQTSLEGGISLVTSDPAVVIYMGMPPYRTKMKRLEYVMKYIDEQSLRAEAVFIDHDVRRERVTVRLAGSSCTNQASVPLTGGST